MAFSELGDLIRRPVSKRLIRAQLGDLIDLPFLDKIHHNGVHGIARALGPIHATNTIYDRAATVRTDTHAPAASERTRYHSLTTRDTRALASNG